MTGGPAPDAGPPVPPDRGGRRAPRPLPLLAAAMFGLLLGLYALVYAVALLAAARIDRVLAVIGAVYLGIAVLCVWGAVQALAGRSGRMLVAGGAVIAVLAALGIVAALGQGGFSLWSVVLLATGAGIVVLVNRPAAKAFITARGAGR
ncbi:hypothetical protein [Geodermatophilus normandii]|uniref:Uncharacterized protein n=1 Tax=Geodermatophilus normandii TaxID=1137989 RepID=A0A6P0GIT9_9ACTN|nr:hypothetical protein [Geodermatophilus normandii]NEM07174.1 hypothetical protein [Geodermatophilus normandii]